MGVVGGSEEAARVHGPPLIHAELMLARGEEQHAYLWLALNQ